MPVTVKCPDGCGTEFGVSAATDAFIARHRAVVHQGIFAALVQDALHWRAQRYAIEKSIERRQMRTR